MEGAPALLSGLAVPFLLTDRPRQARWPTTAEREWLEQALESERRATTLVHVACEWIGNDAPVAAKHYLQVTDDHYREALASPAPRGDAKSGARAAQNRAQQPAARSRSISHDEPEALNYAELGQVVRHPAIVCAGP